MKFFELNPEQTRALDSKVKTTRASYPWDTMSLGSCFLVPQNGKNAYRPSAPPGVRQKGKEFTTDVVLADPDGVGRDREFVRVVRTL